ncbi:hypothetical protein LSAT2_002243 [Lamellibrachia satsuma]|nr:hypothetical protein LSAT2_002243 [Lamellibrachia satsuma]
MGGTSTSLLMFVRADKVMRARQADVGDDILSDMKDGTLKVDPIPPRKLRLGDIEEKIKGNFSCIVKARASGE